MTKQTFIPPQKQKNSDIPQARVKVPAPIDSPTKKKGNPFLTFLPMLGMVAMVGMMALMALQMKQTTGQINVMSMMYPLMMVPMMLPMIMQNLGGGIDLAELNENRVQFAIEQREAREKIHDQGERVHAQQTLQFPAPEALINYIGSKNADHPVMWRVSAADPGGLKVDLATEDGSDDDRKHITYSAYLAPRVGVGTIRRIPYLDIEQEQTVPELLEPASMAMWRHFIKINSFMPAMPVALNLGGAPFYDFEGDPGAILAAGRAMIASLAFNHLPSELKLAIISPDIDKPHWDWMKWLPHVEDTTRQDRHGNARRAYRTLDEFVSAHRTELTARAAFMTETENTDRWIVFIDAPEREVLRPSTLSHHGVDGISFVVLRAGSNDLVTDTRNRFRITETRDLVSATGVVQAKVDQLDVLDAELFAKKMSRYTATAAGAMQSMLNMFDDEEANNATSEKVPDFFEILEIDDIDHWDPTQRWEKIKYDSHLNFPIGYVRSDDDIKAAIPTPVLEFLDLIEMSQGGFPHGVGQGVTGSGKSYLLTAWIATLIALFGPDRLNLILADMKGGSAFNPFRGVPHVSEIVTNLGDDTEFVERFGTVLRGEVQRRQELLAQMDDAKDIYQYRDFMAADPDRFPPLPDLVVFIDEFGKFMEMMKEQPENRQALVDIGRLGRSLGIHLLAFSQDLDEHTVGNDLWQHMQFFVSLQATNSRSSQQMLGVPTAEFFAPGAAMIRYKAKGTVPFMAFTHEAEYRPRTVDAPADEVEDEIQIASDTTLMPFTLENQGLPADPDVPTDTRHSSPTTMLEAAAAAAPEVKPAVPRDRQMLHVLINKLRQHQDITARKLWLPTLREPITLHPDDMRVAPITNIADPTFQIGLIDDAYGHARPPLTLRTDGKNSHVCFRGSQRSGLTQSLAAVIGSASISHDPELASFYVVDPFGAGLSYVTDFINVGSYASQTDRDLGDRIIGEALRLIDYREHAMAANLHTSFASYFHAKQRTPDPNDVYGRYYLVIDRMDQLIERDPSIHPTILRILGAGGACGVHLLATAVTVHWKWQDGMGFVHLYGSDGEPSHERELRQAVTNPRLIPEDYPGRTVQMYKPRGTYLPARMLIPTMEKIEPLGIDKITKRPVWPGDYSTHIREFGQQVRAHKLSRGVVPAAEIAVVPDLIPFAHFWAEFTQSDEYRADRRLGLGLNKGDLKFVLAPHDPRKGSHLVVAGTGQSGRSNVLRIYINSIVQTFPAEEAQIFVADPSFQLKAEADILEREGYLLPDYGYAYDVDSVTNLAKAINTYAVKRKPDIRQLSSEQIVSGSFWSGPRIFVLIDDYQRFNVSSSAFQFMTVFDEIASHLGSIDIGITFIVTVPDLELSKLVDAPDGLGKAFASSQTPVLGLSGGGQIVLRPRLGELDIVRFIKRRAGEAQLYDPGDPEHLPVIQMPFVQPWATASH